VAAIALPKLKLPALRVPALPNPRALLRPAILAPLGAAVALSVAGVVLAGMLGGEHGPAPGEVRMDLAGAVKSAPQSWRAGLRPPGATPVNRRVRLTLTERPAAGAGAGVAAVGPGATPVQIITGLSLAQAPIAGLHAPGPGGPLPIIGADGRTPAGAYARPFKPDGRPKVALVVGGLGLNATTTQQAIETLPPQVTLSFVVYADNLQGWIDLARAKGHEVLIEAPLEPVDYPENDPGPYTLLASGQPAETVKKLEWILSRAAGYFGVINAAGGRFLAEPTAFSAFAGSLKNRGLAFIDTGEAGRLGGGLPRATAERTIDSNPYDAAINRQLLMLEAGALQKGQALGAARAYPVTLTAVARWTREVEARGYQLAPASALTRTR
jgi:polysaccharide deacetylase 2 family uncharacterized protein YibQ